MSHPTPPSKQTVQMLEKELEEARAHTLRQETEIAALKARIRQLESELAAAEEQRQHACHTFGEARKERSGPTYSTPIGEGFSVGHNEASGIHSPTANRSSRRPSRLENCLTEPASPGRRELLRGGSS